MRRSWIVVAVICFVFSFSVAAFGGEQKMDKETYKSHVEKTLKGMDQKMDELKVRAAELKIESKEKFDQEMVVWKKKKEAADRKMEKLKAATAENWEKTKVETDKALAELKKQYEKMLSRFKNP
ncbi:MAG: hypothetical protein HYS23_11185 [Geobacter sp.]|nr:hypothetical protein [Geobacter sp.]